MSPCGVVLKLTCRFSQSSLGLSGAPVCEALCRLVYLLFVGARDKRDQCNQFWEWRVGHGHGLQSAVCNRFFVFQVSIRSNGNGYL